MMFHAQLVPVLPLLLVLPSLPLLLVLPSLRLQSVPLRRCPNRRRPCYGPVVCPAAVHKPTEQAITRSLGSLLMLQPAPGRISNTAQAACCTTAC
jgi:hypothetical protein